MHKHKHIPVAQVESNLLGLIHWECMTNTIYNFWSWLFVNLIVFSLYVSVFELTLPEFPEIMFFYEKT